MKILICSDGMPAAEKAVELGGLLAGPLKAETTLLGIAEKSRDERFMRQALEKQANPFGHEKSRWKSSCMPANRYARFSIKRRRQITTSS